MPQAKKLCHVLLIFYFSFFLCTLSGKSFYIIFPFIYVISLKCGNERNRGQLESFKCLNAALWTDWLRKQFLISSGSLKLTLEINYSIVESFTLHVAMEIDFDPFYRLVFKSNFLQLRLKASCLIF
jgi:hypothetical protein